MLAAEAVLESRAFTDREALEATPPLIDLAAADPADLVRQLDGRTIARFDGRQQTLHLAGARLDTVAMSWRQRALGAIAHPQIAYFLLTLGMLGLTIELWNPGAILPGVAGGLFLLLAFFAFQILPVNAVGLALIVFGLALMLLELKVPSFGALGIGGAISLVIGSIMLTRDTVPGVAPGLGVIVATSIAIAAIVLGLGRLALASQRRPPVTGIEGMIGLEGRARDPLEPGTPGYVEVHGELWRALSRAAVSAGQAVAVVAIEGLTLVVEPSSPGRSGASS
jgi:membrane-bound serine protease (ClpP class)